MVLYSYFIHLLSVAPFSPTIDLSRPPTQPRPCLSCSVCHRIFKPVTSIEVDSFLESNFWLIGFMQDHHGPTHSLMFQFTCTIFYLPTPNFLAWKYCGIGSLSWSQYNHLILFFDFVREDDYQMYEVTVSGLAFLYHQIRCIVAILFMIGQHKENVEVRRESKCVEQW